MGNFYYYYYHHYHIHHHHHHLLYARYLYLYSWDKLCPYGIQCCSNSVVTIHGAYIVSFSVQSIVFLLIIIIIIIIIIISRLVFQRSLVLVLCLRKIRSEGIRQELQISAIQDVTLKYKQHWINHLERTDNNRLPKYVLTYKPWGRRDRGHPSKRWQRVDAGRGQTT